MTNPFAVIKFLSLSLFATIIVVSFSVFPVNAQYGGGGGGGSHHHSTNPTPTPTPTIEVPVGDTYILNPDCTFIKEMSIRFNKSVSGSVSVVNSSNDTAQVPTKFVSGYCKASFSNIAESDVQSVRWTIRLENSWISQNGIKASFFSIFGNSSWANVSIYPSSVDSTYSYYTLETSYLYQTTYAAGGNDTSYVSPTPTPTPAPAPTNTYTKPYTNTISSNTNTSNVIVTPEITDDSITPTPSPDQLATVTPEVSPTPEVTNISGEVKGLMDQKQISCTTCDWSFVIIGFNVLASLLYGGFVVFKFRNIGLLFAGTLIPVSFYTSFLVVNSCLSTWGLLVTSADNVVCKYFSFVLFILYFVIVGIWKLISLVINDGFSTDSSSASSYN